MILQQLILVQPDTGRIISFIAGNGSVDISPHHEGLEIYESEYVDPALYYVKDGDITARPDCPVQLAYTATANIIVLSGVPKGVTVKLQSVVSGEHDIVMNDDDGYLKLEFPTSGKYEITCEVFPARKFHATVEV